MYNYRFRDYALLKKEMTVVSEQKLIHHISEGKRTIEWEYWS